jgi:hypothetical protein
MHSNYVSLSVFSWVDLNAESRISLLHIFFSPAFSEAFELQLPCPCWCFGLCIGRSIIVGWDGKIRVMIMQKVTYILVSVGFSGCGPFGTISAWW